MRNLIIVLGLVSISACVDAEERPAVYSCLVRFQCVGSDDILAREHFPCATDEASAEAITHDVSFSIAESRCGKGSWSWTRVTCGDAPEPDTVSLCEAE